MIFSRTFEAGKNASIANLYDQSQAQAMHDRNTPELNDKPVEQNVELILPEANSAAVFRTSCQKGQNLHGENASKRKSQYLVCPCITKILQKGQKGTKSLIVVSRSSSILR